MTDTYNIDRRPPCWDAGKPCPNAGERFSERRLRGLLWRTEAADLRDAARARNIARKARQQSMVKVVVVDLGDWRERHFGRAG